jgi:hypothetical protein
VRHHLYLALGAGLFCTGFNLAFTPGVTWHPWAWAALGAAWLAHAGWAARRRFTSRHEYTAWLVDEDLPSGWQGPEPPRRR